MFKRIFVEESVKDLHYTQNILANFSKITPEYIDKIENIWGRVKKPYLQKRTNLNLFIGRKEGQLVKEAPDAYGLGHEKHFYFVHAYNCIYECQYCYLQGYFNTPDIVLYVNHDEIIAQMQKIADKYPDAWFHAGEYSDSMALSHLTNEWPLYWEFFKKNPQAKLELRTKSVNVKVIQDLPPLDNVFVSFTIAGHEEGKLFDYKCPSVKARLKTIEKLANLDFRIGIHFDPIIYSDNCFEHYNEVILELMHILPEKQLGYVSVGVVRFTKPVYKEVEKNYPDSKLLAQDFVKSFDGKVRYNHPMRMWILNKVKQLCIDAGVTENKVYLCMEEDF